MYPLDLFKRAGLFQSADTANRFFRRTYFAGGDEQALRAVLSAIPIDVVNTMGIPAEDPYAKFGEPPVWNDYRQILKDSGMNVALEPIMKWDFYKAVESADHVLTIQTADQALWANVLLSVGCRTA